MIILLLIFLLAALVPNASAQPRKLVRVYVAGREQAQSLAAMPLDFASPRIQRYAEVIVTDEEERLLRARGFKLETKMPDLDRAFAERFANTQDLGAYHTYQEMYDEMVAIAGAHPGITRMMSLGRSLENREVWAMKVSDNPAAEENAEADLLFMANMHSRELITPEIILHLLNHLVDNYGSDSLATALVDGREFWLVPTQNPDGHVYVETTDPWWRKNRRSNGNGTFGVDLNRNYGYQWGYDDIGSSPNSSSETYRGTSAFSEPESQIIRQLCQSHHFVLALSFHSYGRLWLFPWGYIPQDTPDHRIFMELASNCVAFNGYEAGNPASGTIYITNGDTDDYFYGEQSEKNRFFSFTPEVGDEFWPPDSEIPALLAENLEPCLYLAEIAPLMAENPYRILRPAAPVLDALSTDNDGAYTVSWTINNDPNNPAVRYQLDELSGYTTVVDGAETGAGNWALDGFVVSTARAYGGSHSFYSGQGDNVDRRMSATFPLNVATQGTLTFRAWYDIESDWDYAYVEVSVDGGVTFASISGNITTTNNPHGTNLGNGITGASNGWVQATFSLNAFIGQAILLRFRYKTDQVFTGEGFYLDEISPVPTYQTVQTLSNTIANDSYAISGRGSGTYFYRVRAQDAELQWGGWSNLEDISVELALGNLGDLDGDGLCNSTDALIMLSFDAGLAIPPDHLARIQAGVGDINDDGFSNSTDALIVLSFDAGMQVPYPVCQPMKQ